MEQAIARILASTEDGMEGPRAFSEKRPPNFRGL
jgi:1,4-dihydroxy-2-naphthoyl-CoA synthase